MEVNNNKKRLHAPQNYFSNTYFQFNNALIVTNSTYNNSPSLLRGYFMHPLYIYEKQNNDNLYGKVCMVSTKKRTKEKKL
jgi:hypothetical protein